MAAETSFFSQRPLTQMIVGGVFERFCGPALRPDRQGASWIGPALPAARLVPRPDGAPRGIGELKYAPDQVLP